MVEQALGVQAHDPVRAEPLSGSGVPPDMTQQPAASSVGEQMLQEDGESLDHGACGTSTGFAEGEAESSRGVSPHIVFSTAHRVLSLLSCFRARRFSFWRVRITVDMAHSGREEPRLPCGPERLVPFLLLSVEDTFRLPSLRGTPPRKGYEEIPVQGEGTSMAMISSSQLSSMGHGPPSDKQDIQKIAVLALEKLTLHFKERGHAALRTACERIGQNIYNRSEMKIVDDPSTLWQDSVRRPSWTSW